MKLDDLVKRKSEWLKGEGEGSNIAISTRVRIARNVKGHVFSNRADTFQREKTLRAVFSAMKKSNFLKKALFLRMKDAVALDRQFLVERHLMSKDHMQNVEQKGLVVEEKEIVSAMVNEEDHIRLQVIQSGFSITEAWRIVDEIDAELCQHLAYEYSSKFGYLTSCPTNTGTGLRASVMLHLSALVMTGQIEKVYEAISKVGLTMRGFYGEGTEALGDFFQISNQVAMGHSEMDILDNLNRIIKKIMTKEKHTRQELFRNKEKEISDGIFRSLGTLKSARIITSSEAIKLLSAIRLGIDLGFIKDVGIAKVNEILLMTQPAHLQKIEGTDLGPYERDIKRAEFIKERLEAKGDHSPQ